jgi:Matrixin
MKRIVRVTTAIATASLVTTGATAAVPALSQFARPTPGTPAVTVTTEAVLVPGADAVGPAATGAATPTPYALSGYQVSGTIPFGYNPAGAPAPVARYAGSVVRAALDTVSSGATRGRPSTPIDVAATYTGLTDQRPQVSPTGAPTGNDGQNVVGWGLLPVGYLAVTCIYHAGNVVLNADVLVSTRYRWYLGCPAHRTGSYDLQSVLTHEQGHTFGLGHVDQQWYGSQTMAPFIAADDSTKRLLGTGDRAGLVSLYGTR